MFDAALALTETRSLAIIAEHNIRHAVEAKDLLTLNEMHEILDRVTEYARRQRVKALKTPKLTNWTLWCSWCGFAWGKNLAGRDKCPDCGEKMTVWDLDKGSPPKRKENV